MVGKTSASDTICHKCLQLQLDKCVLIHDNKHRKKKKRKKKLQESTVKIDSTRNQFYG